MTDIVERAEAALEGVTPGEWEWNRWGGLVAGREVYVLDFDGMASEITYTEADGEFIAAARQLVPELVAELKTARAQRDEFRAQLDAALLAAADEAEGAG
ncbi:hypothetical protein [Mycobacterium asiaticum]|uniref:hypothetical protein n=1 Tax=Mycobacterium asiaticum TaxID=1790 RepID=UPI0007EFFFB3|nr:hypothetical protein [Mycobacterium asiaticum]OBJ62513.1 hypothetical protein A9W94_11870 [Mycobacterium asiaticum]